MTYFAIGSLRFDFILKYTYILHGEVTMEIYLVIVSGVWLRCRSHAEPDNVWQATRIRRILGTFSRPTIY